MSETPKPTAARWERARRLADRWWKAAGLLVAALLAVAVSGASVQAIRLLGEIAKRPTISVEGLARGHPDDPGYFDHPRNVLVLGSDTRRGLSPEQQAGAGTPQTVEGERSDTIILLHIDPRREEAVVVHFPRDLRVTIPGHGPDKINAAYELGGPNLTVRTVKAFTGLPIHNYVEVSLAGFQRIVDLLNGVQICVDRPMVDELAGLNLPKAGCYWLDGRGALAFVRARHIEGDTIPDFSRIRRQQQFMRSFFAKLISIGSFLDADLIRQAARQVTTDDRLQAVDLIDLGRELSKLAEGDRIGAESLEFRVVPGTAGSSFVYPDREKADLLFDALRAGRPLPAVGLAPVGLAESPAVIKVRVLQAGTFQDAAAVANQLRASGFIVLQTEPAPPSYEQSEILYDGENRSRGQIVQGYPYVRDLELVEGQPFVLDGADVAVVIGEDYRPTP
jgi:LCP family protein required for cell wall assembly